MKLLATKEEKMECVTGPGTWEVCSRSEKRVGWQADPCPRDLYPHEGLDKFRI